MKYTFGLIDSAPIASHMCHGGVAINLVVGTASSFPFEGSYRSQIYAYEPMVRSLIKV
jgi:hypothetical protein